MTAGRETESSRGSPGRLLPGRFGDSHSGAVFGRSESLTTSLLLIFQCSEADQATANKLAVKAGLVTHKW